MSGQPLARPELRWMSAVRQGFLLLLPLAVIGGLALFLQHLPIAAYQAAMQEAFGTEWRSGLRTVWQASYGMLALSLVLSISYSLVSLSRRGAGDNVHPLAAAGVALMCYLIAADVKPDALPVTVTGVQGLLPAVLCSLLASEVFLRLSRWPRLNLRLIGETEPLLGSVFSALAPALLTVAGCFVVSQLLRSFLPAPGGYLAEGLVRLFAGTESELSRALLFNFLSHVLWFFGAHGSNLLDAVTRQFFDPATAANTAALLNGQLPPHIVTKPFFDVFIFLGGSGATAGLLLALMCVGRHDNMRRIGLLSAPPAFINLNEPLIYGLPIVLNPVFLLPFVGLPLLLTLSSWGAFQTGLVPPSVSAVDWTTPMFLNAWQTTHSWRGVALQAFNLGLATLLYLPFVHFAVQRQHALNTGTFRLQLHQLQDMLQHAPQPIATRHDAIGRLARQLLADLSRDLTSGAIHLVYQPKLDLHRQVRGVEALLRWDHPLVGAVPPTVVVGVMEDAGRIRLLGHWIINAACKQLAEWRADGLHGITMAVNISPLQLSDAELVPQVARCLEKWQLHPQQLELEITETRSVGNDAQTHISISALNALGVSLAMDDFGMGYSSLLYMRRFRIDTIKLDGSLTRDVESNPSCRDIIATVAQLCESRNVMLVAEYIERESQFELLRSLGCQEFQGFMFSPPLHADACFTYIQRRNIALQP